MQILIYKWLLCVHCIVMKGSVLCQPIGQPVKKCHTKRCLESRDNAAGHTTFIGAANMSAGLVTVVSNMVICPVFL